MTTGNKNWARKKKPAKEHNSLVQYMVFTTNAGGPKLRGFEISNFNATALVLFVLATLAMK